MSKVRALCHSAYGYIESTADGSRKPSENEFQHAQYQGRKIAETATTLSG
ncbi:MAG TPA: hypothetical protein VNX86_16315 [Rhizomicrobium sp.]|jgi:hypothetical protein|nr:hypothetical protein [Rhizomicrobium sp.]